MKEYTLLCLLSILFTFWLNKALKTDLFRKPEYYFYLVFILFGEYLVNGFITGREVVLYDKDFFLGYRIGTIPVEDFLFGFSMVTVVIIFWEFFKREKKDKDNVKA